MDILSSQEQEEVDRDKDYRKRIEEGVKNSKQQEESPYKGKQEANVKVFKSKSIMECFVKSKNSKDNKLSGPLKASGGGAFKHQKSTRTQIQWEKAKSLILSEENVWKNTPIIQKQHHKGIGEAILNSRPPDLSPIEMQEGNTSFKVD